MATQIESVELWVERVAATDFDLIVSIYSNGSSNSAPDTTDLLGSKTIAASGINPEDTVVWLLVTFDSPITIPSDGYYGLHVTHNASSGFQSSRVRLYEATDYASAPGFGTEEAWEYDGSWHHRVGDGIGYRINYVGGSVGNKADGEQEIIYEALNAFSQQGNRTRLELELVLPGKATNPTPADTGTEVDFSGLVLDWDTGADTDTFSVYMGPVGDLSLIATGIVPSTFTVDLADVPKEQIIYWRVDSVNGDGTTTGDTWNFDARPAKAVTPSPTNTQSGITLDESPLSWEAG